jgi:hypothetical protein
MLITSTIFYALKSYKGGTSASRLEAMEGTHLSPWQVAVYVCPNRFIFWVVESTTYPSPIQDIENAF